MAAPKASRMVSLGACTASRSSSTLAQPPGDENRGLRRTAKARKEYMVKVEKARRKTSKNDSPWRSSSPASLSVRKACAP